MSQPIRVRVQKIGNRLGILLPDEVMDQLRLVEGDELTVSIQAEGFRIANRDHDLDEGMKCFEDIRQRYRNTFRKLSE